MRIQHNIMAMNAYRNYTRNTSALSKNLEKLSSGYRINRAGDDAAGLAISEKMRAQITGLEAAQKNVKDGISLVNTSEGAMQEIQDMLNRMVYLATESANGTYDDPVDRKNLQQEVDQLRSEINRIADSANFNGIKLLDGSLDAEGTTTISPDSAISNIQTTDYSANGASPAFEATYVTNRPEAATYQTNAQFSVSLDDLGFTGQVKKNDTFELTIGDAKIEYTVQDGQTIADASDLAGFLVKCGYKMDSTNNATFAGGNAATPDVDGKDTTAKWDDKTGKTTISKTATSADNKYIKVDGHWYEMSVNAGNGKQIDFKQVDYMGTSGATIDPNFEVGIDYNQDTNNEKVAVNDMTGTVNDHVQQTVSGSGIGSSHQAQVDLAIDFSKLKDGDKLIVGDKTYTFKVGKDGEATGTNLIDLSKLLKEEADLQDASKLNKAMTLITHAIDGTTADIKESYKGDTTAAENESWSSGNFGVKGTVGTISLQSKSTLVDDQKIIGTGAAVTAPGAGVTDPTPDIDKINMTTEANIMRQFDSERAANNASTSFDVDVTKIKQGDQITINGVKFEFWSEGNMKDENATKIDLDAIGADIKNGKLLASQTSDVMNAIKTAVCGALGNDFTITTDDNTLKIESKDNPGTGVKENKISAKVELAQEAYAGRALTLQIGDTSDDYNQLAVSVKDMHVESLGIDKIDISNAEGAKAAVDIIKGAINTVSEVRGKLGAISNRLDHTANNLSVMRENITDAESSIRDTDVAEEMMAYTKNNILVQSAQAMLAQANQVPQGVLQLLQ